MSCGLLAGSRLAVSTFASLASSTELEGSKPGSCNEGACLPSFPCPRNDHAFNLCLQALSCGRFRHPAHTPGHSATGVFSTQLEATASFTFTPA